MAYLAHTKQNVDQSTRNASLSEGIPAGRRTSHGTYNGTTHTHLWPCADHASR